MRRPARSIYSSGMLLRTPFHDRVAAANQTSLWSHWAGHLVVERYQMSEKWEYTAIRNAVGVFDSSPLYKYRITGPDAERYLATVLSRDIRSCRPGQAHYTIWCDDRGFVNEDGVVYRLSDDDFLLTAAQPNLAHLSQLINGRAGGHHRCEPGVRDPGRAGTAKPSGPGRADRRRRPSRLLRPHHHPARRPRRRRHPGPNRVHRRSGLRDPGPDRRSGGRHRGLGSAVRGRAGSRHRAVRADGTAHGPDRSRAAADRRRLRAVTPGRERRTPLHTRRTRIGLDAA